MNDFSKIEPASVEDGEDIRADFIPASRYSDTASALEKDRLWPRIWHIVCREEEIAEVGQYVTYEIFDESVIVTRTAPDEIKAYYNVCQHRGRRLVEPGRGKLRGFFCKFHGWKYKLDGSISHVFHREQWDNCPGFTDDKLNLKEPKVDRWGGWVWINMDPDSESLAEWLGDMLTSRIAPFELETLSLAWHKTIIAPVNWKVVVEAFNEGYHSGATHSSLFDYGPMVSPGVVHGKSGMYSGQSEGLSRAKREDGTWADCATMQEMLYYSSKELSDTLFALVPPPMMRAVTRLRHETPGDMPVEDVFKRFWELQIEELEATGARWPERLTPADQAAAGISWHVFPNTIFLPAPDGVLWYRMRPFGDDPKQCVFDIWGLQRYAPGQEPTIEHEMFNGFDAARGVNPFLEQDFDNMFAVDRGMRSRGWTGARTNPSEEALVVNLHRLIDRYLATPPGERVDEQLA